jgi:hypothetical protein
MLTRSVRSLRSYKDMVASNYSSTSNEVTRAALGCSSMVESDRRLELKWAYNVYDVASSFQKLTTYWLVSLMGT